MFIISSVDTGGPEELLHHSVIQPIRVPPHPHPHLPHPARQPSQGMCVYIPTVAAYTDAFLIATTILPTADPRLHGEVHPLHVLGGGSGCVCNTDVLLISICILLVARQPDSDQDRSSALSRTNLPCLPWWGSHHETITLCKLMICKKNKVSSKHLEETILLMFCDGFIKSVFW